MPKKLVGTTAFVVENATLCQFAVREAVVAQMSRNPALMAGFATRGQWFPDVVEYVVQTCDAIRARIDSDLRVPDDGVVSSEIADELSYGKWWANKVYRLQKWDFASRVAKVRLSLRAKPLQNLLQNINFSRRPSSTKSR